MNDTVRTERHRYSIECHSAKAMTKLETMSTAGFIIIIILAVLGLAAYLLHVNHAMAKAPEEALLLSPHRWTVDEVKEAYEEAARNPIDVRASLPPKLGRRYIVVGGSGLVGTWLVTHLLDRGEDSSAIRVLDLQSPPRELLDRGIAYIKTDITDQESVSQAFLHHPWPSLVTHLTLTVFHTAAIIRPGERAKEFLPRCTKVNVDGTRNVLAASKQAGARTFISTSSGSICSRRVSFWIPPWSNAPRNVVQIVSDSTPVHAARGESVGNYSTSKAEAEKIVREADDAGSQFRTGCVRPVNGIYGIESSTTATVTGDYLRRKSCPTWNPQMVHSWANAENVSIAHLCYEQRLADLQSPLRSPSSTLPDIGGSAYAVTDPNPPIAFRDIYLLLSTLSKTPAEFPVYPPIIFFILSYCVEWYCLLQHRYLSFKQSAGESGSYSHTSAFWLCGLFGFLFSSKVPADLAILHPGLFNLCSVHCIADDSRARKKPEDRGLGYSPPLTTLDGLCKQLVDWNRQHQGDQHA